MKTVIAAQGHLLRREGRTVAARGGGVLKVLTVAFAGFMLALGAGAVHAQEARDWRSPDGAIQLTIPEMWNAVAQSEPEVLILVRSLGLGPAGPAEIVCTVERRAVPAEVTFTREQVNGMAQVAFEQMLEREHTPASSFETVNGVRVGAYEVSGARGKLAERRFARMFLLQQEQSIARYLLICAVRTARPGADVDYASTRAFLSSLQINAEAHP